MTPTTSILEELIGTPMMKLTSKLPEERAGVADGQRKKRPQYPGHRLPSPCAVAAPRRGGRGADGDQELFGFVDAIVPTGTCSRRQTRQNVAYREGCSEHDKQGDKDLSRASLAQGDQTS